MSDSQQAIDKLRSSPHYKELADYEPPFNPFEIVGATHLELIHSSVLAWLLRDEANKEFRQKFITWIIDRVVAESEKTEDLIKSQELQGGSVTSENLENSSLKIAKKTKEDLIELQKLWEGLDVPEKPIVGTEEGDKASRYDVSVHFEYLNFVIGIEVKVWAKEQPKQVKRYQDLLHEGYSDDKKAVVFLTPGGWEPKTSDKYNVYVPVLTMSWGCVSKIIREMQSVLGDENEEDKNNFRMQFLQHLERNIAKNKIEEQRIVHKLLSEGNNLEIIKEVTSEMNTWDDKEAIKGKIDKDMVQKIINNRYSLQTSLECEFWRALREQLKKQLQLQDKELEFQLYQSDSSTKVIENEKLDTRLKEYIKWGYDGWPGLTFSIPCSSLGQDDDHEVACRITYNPVSISHVFYGFVLCKKDDISDIRNRVEIDDENHKEYLDLYGELKGEILDHGPDEDGKHGWLGWNNDLKKVDIYFANKPALFDTLVKIKERKENKVVDKLVDEICDVVERISKQTRERRNSLTHEKSDSK